MPFDIQEAAAAAARQETPPVSEGATDPGAGPRPRIDAAMDVVFVPQKPATS